MRICLYVPFVLRQEANVFVEKEILCHTYCLHMVIVCHIYQIQLLWLLEISVSVK